MSVLHTGDADVRLDGTRFEGVREVSYRRERKMHNVEISPLAVAARLGAVFAALLSSHVDRPRRRRIRGLGDRAFFRPATPRHTRQRSDAELAVERIRATNRALNRHRRAHEKLPTNPKKIGRALARQQKDWR